METPLRLLIWLANGLLTLAFAVGWFQHPLAQYFKILSPMELHLSISGVAVLISLFKDTCVLFYFIGTGVWIKDRAKELLTREKDRALRIWKLYELANKLKGRSMPFATLGLVLALFTFILGGAHQVGAIPHWMHPTLASLLLLIAWGSRKFYFGAIAQNLDYLDQVSKELGDEQLPEAVSRTIS